MKNERTYSVHAIPVELIEAKWLHHEGQEDNPILLLQFRHQDGGVLFFGHPIIGITIPLDDVRLLINPAVDRQPG